MFFIISFHVLPLNSTTLPAYVRIFWKSNRKMALRGQDEFLDMPYPKATINYRREWANDPSQIALMRPSDIARTLQQTLLRGSKMWSSGNLWRIDGLHIPSEEQLIEWSLNRWLIWFVISWSYRGHYFLTLFWIESYWSDRIIGQMSNSSEIPPQNPPDREKEICFDIDAYWDLVVPASTPHLYFEGPGEIPREILGVLPIMDYTGRLRPIGNLFRLET